MTEIFCVKIIDKEGIEKPKAYLMFRKKKKKKAAAFKFLNFFSSIFIKRKENIRKV
jgi:hypothetical protein